PVVPFDPLPSSAFLPHPMAQTSDTPTHMTQRIPPPRRKKKNFFLRLPRTPLPPPKGNLDPRTEYATRSGAYALRTSRQAAVGNCTWHEASSLFRQGGAMDDKPRKENEGEGSKSADKKYREAATDFAR